VLVGLDRPSTLSLTGLGPRILANPKHCNIPQNESEEQEWLAKEGLVLTLAIDVVKNLGA